MTYLVSWQAMTLELVIKASTGIADSSCTFSGVDRVVSTRSVVVGAVVVVVVVAVVVLFSLV